MLNSFEELCITWVATMIYIYNFHGWGECMPNGEKKVFYS